MEEPKNKYILLLDRVGYTLERNILSLGLFKTSTPTQVLQGELLEALPEAEQPSDSTRIALVRIDRKSLRLECSVEDLIRLSDEDANLLLPISSSELRYQMFTNKNRLDFGRRVSSGDEVFVSVKRISEDVDVPGVIWYRGELPSCLGTMFGVELVKNPGQGTSDGTFRNQRYFTCAPDSAVFVGLDKLAPREDPDSKPPENAENALVNLKSRLRDTVTPSFLQGKNEQTFPQGRSVKVLEIDQRFVTVIEDYPGTETIRRIGEEKDSSGNKCILLHDRVGYTLERSILSLGLFKTSTPTQVLRGKLLEALPEAEQPSYSTRIALVGVDRKSLRLECSVEDLIRLSDEDANLLLPVSSSELRYQMFINKQRLDFGRKVSSGDEVFVSVKGISEDVDVPGVIWYRGELPSCLGTMFGVELASHPGQGTCDGTLGNKRYFTCAPDSGVFVGLDKLAPREDPDSKPPPHSPKRAENTLVNLESILKDTVTPSFLPGKNEQTFPQGRSDKVLEIDQRVVTFIEDHPARGTVRYIGEEKDLSGNTRTIVGLEMDKRIGSGTGKRRGRQLFVCQRGFAWFVDLGTVIPEKDFDENTTVATGEKTLDKHNPIQEQIRKDELYARSIAYDNRTSGEESKVRRTNPFDSSADISEAAGESSRLDISAFIEQQHRILGQIKRSRASRNRDNDEDTDMRYGGRTSQLDFQDDFFETITLYSGDNDEDTDMRYGGRTSQLDFKDDYFETITLYSEDDDETLMGKHGRYANSKGYSDDEMHQQQGLDGAERTLLAAEAVSDCNPRTGEETEGATPFKEPSEQREMQTAVLQSEDSVADKRTVSRTNGPNENVQRQLRELEQQVTRMEQQLREKDRESREKEQQLTHLQRQLGEKELQEASLQEQLREKNQQDKNSQRQLKEMEVQMIRMELQMGEKDRELENSERLSREMEQQLQGQLREMEQQLREMEVQEESLQRQLREMEQQLTNVQEQLAERDEESGSLQQQLTTLQGQLRAKDQDLNELEITLATARQALSRHQHQRQQSPDWVISRDQIQLTDKLLGRGGWGFVVEGKYCGCAVAVKKIHELILSAHNRSLFEREMDIASRCRHPCLLQFIGATNDEGSPLFLTELMESSLRALLEQRPLTAAAEVSIISLDVSRALSYLHQKTPPIIHRDISSANVLLWRQGDQWRGKVSDYGTANFMQQTMTAAPGARIYSAPEALTSNQTVKVDVYSFGVLLCEMCIQELPDPERRDQQIVMVANRLLRALIRRCLQPKPEARPNMEEIIEELEKTV